MICSRSGTRCCRYWRHCARPVEGTQEPASTSCVCIERLWTQHFTTLWRDACQGRLFRSPAATGQKISSPLTLNSQPGHSYSTTPHTATCYLGLDNDVPKRTSLRSYEAPSPPAMPPPNRCVFTYREYHIIHKFASQLLCISSSVNLNSASLQRSCGSFSGILGLHLCNQPCTLCRSPQICLSRRLIRAAQRHQRTQQQHFPQLHLRLLPFQHNPMQTHAQVHRQTKLQCCKGSKTDLTAGCVPCGCAPAAGPGCCCGACAGAAAALAAWPFAGAGLPGVAP